MSINEHTSPEKLERYAFLWSIARMVIAAFSLFFGAMPIIYRLGSSSSFSSILPLLWLISGASAAYLLYLWHNAGHSLRAGNDNKSRAAFLIMIISGLNLGLAAVGSNLGMNLVWDMPIADILFKVTAILYLLVAHYLFTQWKANGERLF